ncbi:heat shock protein 70 family, partial [Mycena sp. CBHHK59/15]
PLLVVPEDEPPLISVTVAGQSQNFSAVQLAGMVLRELRAMAEGYDGRRITQAVITVPANFDDGKRQAMKDAARLAGLCPVRLLDEPVSVAMAYGLDQILYGAVRGESYALVHDAGSTVTSTMLSIVNGDIQIVASTQEPEFGGLHFNKEIFKYAAEAYWDAFGSELDEMQESIVWDEAEAAKVALSTEPDAMISIPIQDGSFLVLLTREDFDDSTYLVNRAIHRTIDEVLKIGGIQASDMNHTILTGGSAYIPRVKAAFNDHFPDAALLSASEPYPDEAVVFGAAMYARLLALGQVPETSKIYVQNMTPLRFGVGDDKGEFAELISQNSPLPITGSRRCVLSLFVE